MSDVFAKMTPEEIKFMVDGYDIEIKKLQAENEELKKQSNKQVRKVLCEIGIELENDARINKKSMPFVRAVVINKIYDYPAPPEGE